MPFFDKTVESVHCVQMVETRFFRFLVIAVLNRTVCNSRKGMVTPQPVTKGERSVCDMPVKYTDEFPSAGFCSVGGGGNGFPFGLNARTGADIFIGNASFLAFVSCLRAVLITVLSSFLPL